MTRYVTVEHGTVVHIGKRVYNNVFSPPKEEQDATLCGMKVKPRHVQRKFRSLTKLESLLFEATNHSYICQTCAEKTWEKEREQRNKARRLKRRKTPAL